MDDVLAVLWDTKYVGLLYTACTAHIQYLCVSTLLNTQYTDIRYWLYCMLKLRKQKQQTASKHWCPFPNIASFNSAFLFFLLCLPLSELDTFLSVSCDWRADARCRSHDAYNMLIPFLFPCHFFFSVCLFYLTSELTEIIYEWCDHWWLFNRDPYSVLKGQGWWSMPRARLSITGQIYVPGYNLGN